MTRRNKDQYAFPCAIIKANEKTLLSEADLIKVLEVKQLANAMSILGEFGYGDGKELENPRDFEKVLRQELARVYRLVFSVVPEKSEMELFLLPNDYHNAKVLLKSEFLDIDAAPYLVDTGSIESETLLQAVKERNFIFMSLEMKQAIEEAVDMFSRSRDPQAIDIILDKACYEDMLSRAVLTEDDFIICYVKLLIDILNVNTFIRLREISKPWAFFQKVFIEGGDIDERVFTTSYEESYQQLADKFAPYGFRDVFAVGAATVRENKKYAKLEKLCDDMKINYVHDARYVSFGIEPLVSFLVAKESEIKNLRMILTGKLTGTEPEVIKERLRKTYV